MAVAVAAKVAAGILIGFPSDPWTVTVPSGPGFNCPNWACATNAGGITTGLPSEPAIVTGPKNRYIANKQIYHWFIPLVWYKPMVF